MSSTETLDLLDRMEEADRNFLIAGFTCQLEENLSGLRERFVTAYRLSDRDYLWQTLGDWPEYVETMAKWFVPRGEYNYRFLAATPAPFGVLWTTGDGITRYTTSTEGAFSTALIP